jgi:lysophospholipase L1-like esterase
MALVSLPDGRVLSVGGSYGNSGPSTSAEAALFDPSTGQWTTTTPPHFARSGASAIVLADGKVLVAGGGPAESELYDPATATWSVAAALNVPRGNGHMIGLDTGDVLMAAGYATADGQPTTVTELYNETSTTPTVPYVAFGDSITTGGSVPDCQFDPTTSPWGCTTTSAVPYPDRVAASLGYSNSDDAATYKAAAPGPPSLGLFRVGIWGYTVKEAAIDAKNGINAKGPWLPQLTAAADAQKLVTGALGINDLHIDDWKKWLGLLLKSSQSTDLVTDEANTIIKNRSADFDAMFNALDSAKVHGSRVIITLYYNPYDTFSDRCLAAKTISTRLLNVLDGELSKRALAHGFLPVDFRPVFQAHGAESTDPYVFATQCKAASAVSDWLPTWLSGHSDTESAIQAKFDPHPNNKGTQAMADAILKVAK